MAIPIIRLDSLPLQSLGSGNTATVPVVLDNTTTARVPWNDFIGKSVKAATTVPAAPSSSGVEQSMIASSEGLYVYCNGSWRKSPLYADNWDDLSKDTRFLLVNTLMQLTDQQIENVYNTLKLALATQEKAGLVRAMTDEEAAASSGAAVKVNTNGTMFVPAASDTHQGTVVYGEGQQGPVATVDYVDTQIDSIAKANIPVATDEALGGVLSGGSDGAFTVDENGNVTLRSAAIGSYGIVKLADGVAQGQPGVPTSGDVYIAIRDQIELIGKISTSNPEKPSLTGIAKKGAWDDTTNPSATAGSNSGPLYVKSDGVIDAYPATTIVPGVVLLTNDVTQAPQGQNYTAVPTTDAVQKYVTTMVGRQEIDINMPIATRAQLGGIVVGASFNIDANTGLLTIKAADEATRGGVVLASSIDSGVGVTTAIMVKAYVDDRIEQIDGAIAEIRTQLDFLEGKIDNSGSLT